MKRMNLTNKTAVINPEYKHPTSFVQKRLNKQLKFTNLKISNKINSKTLITSRKDTRNTYQ
jgi:hypothetical protein